jgi:hypothetical protein
MRENNNSQTCSELQCGKFVQPLSDKQPRNILIISLAHLVMMVG